MITWIIRRFIQASFVVLAMTVIGLARPDAHAHTR